MTTDSDLRRSISKGVLSFPATVFAASGELDEGAFGEHIADLTDFGPAALVPAGGAGEVFSLSMAEHRRVVKIGVANARGIPVIAGAGQGIANAREMAVAAEQEGASGILLFPPYLIRPEQDGLKAYVESVCGSVSIPVIAYSRDNGVIEPDTALSLVESCENLVAIKDGTGDFEALVSLKQRAGDRLAIINGVPTAEIVARQFFAAGVTSYTSAVFTFLPPVALRFYRALREDDVATMDRLLADFYVPLAALRRRRRGYAVSIVKAGLRVMGKPAGAVRPPLVDLAAAETHELAVLIARALDIVGAAPTADAAPARAAE